MAKAEEERAAQVAAGQSDPPLVSQDEIWVQTVGGRKRGRVYGMGRVNTTTTPRFADDPTPDEMSTASGPDMREQITLLNRELTRQMQQQDEQQTRYADLEARYHAEREEWKLTHERQQLEITRQQGEITRQRGEITQLQHSFATQNAEVSDLKSTVSQLYTFMQSMQGSSSSGGAQLPPPPPLTSSTPVGASPQVAPVDPPQRELDEDGEEFLDEDYS